jgi:hypothetical protein
MEGIIIRKAKLEDAAEIANVHTISFYEKVGGKFSGKTKSDEIAGSKVTELCYVWENLNL